MDINVDMLKKAGGLAKYLFKLYKESHDKEEEEVNKVMATSVAVAADADYHSFRVFLTDDSQGLYDDIRKILLELEIKDCSAVARDSILKELVHSLRNSGIITVETVNGTGCEADIDQFYVEFEKNLRRILNDNPYKNDFNFKKVIMDLEVACTNNTDDIKENLTEVKEILINIQHALQSYSDDTRNEKKSKKIMIINLGEFNKEDYNDNLNLKKYFDGRTLKSSYSWDIIKEEIYNFSEKIKKNACRDIPYDIYFSCQLSIAYCLGVCINSKANCSINVHQKTGLNFQDWTIDVEKSKDEFKDKLFIIPSQVEILDENSKDIAVCISTRNSICEETKEYMKVNNMSVKKIIDINFGNEGGNSFVINGTHAWYLADQVKSAINKFRSFKEQNGKLHVFMAVPVSVSFFLGQFFFDVSNIMLYEYNIKGAIEGKYIPSIFIESPDDLG